MGNITDRKGRMVLFGLAAVLLAAIGLAVMSDRWVQADVWRGGRGAAPNVVLQTGDCGDPGATRQYLGTREQRFLASYVFVCPGSP